MSEKEIRQYVEDNEDIFDGFYDYELYTRVISRNIVGDRQMINVGFQLSEKGRWDSRSGILSINEKDIIEYLRDKKLKQLI